MSPPSLRKLPAVLVVDDEVRSQEALRRTLEEDFDVLCASSAAEGMEILEREMSTAAVRIVLCDQRMPGMTGVQFLKEVRHRWPDVVRIILSGYTDAEDIITGVNEAGIWQYLLKPWQPEQLLLTLQRAAEVWRLQQENQRLSLDLRTAEPVLKKRVQSKFDKAKHAFGLSSFIRQRGSPLNDICEMIERVAPFDLAVLVTGESGTGKEMVARAIHYESRRAERPFITENCGALPDTLLESELFGYKRGAFTGAVEDRVGLFQQADGGTLFLDEIGETSPAFQVKLLRVLQEGEFRPLGSNRPVHVDVRVIAATNRDLEEDVRTGRFREDLYYRLATISLHVPPLRERPMDLPLLARRLLDRAVSCVLSQLLVRLQQVLAQQTHALQ
jgi:two-component system response regulator HupR/HoxA